MYQFGYLRKGGSGFSGGGSTGAPAQPQVVSSTTRRPAEGGILVEWDRPMHISAELYKAMTVKVDGKIVTVTDVVQNPNEPKEIGILVTPPLKANQKITWAYDDQHPTENLAGADGHEAINQTYTVTDLIHELTADTAVISADTDAYTADEGA